MSRSFRWLQTALPIVTAALVIGTMWGAFFYAAREKSMGDVQRIFYFHAPAGLICFLAFFVTFVAGIGYLATRKPAWDIVGNASAEIGLLFCSIVLFTGPLWARPVWGTYWTWEARLTTTLILWLIYAGYILVRRYTDEPERRARFAAVVGIIGFLDVPLVYWSIRFWRGHHPVVLETSRRLQGMENGQGGLEESMSLVFRAGIITYIVLYACLMALRVPLGRAEEEARWLEERVSSAGRLRAAGAVATGQERGVGS